MKVYAHRGASQEQPENTLSAFRRALEIGVFGIELDVHLSKDGVPVIIHDPTVERTTDGKGRIAEMTLADLKELDAGEGEQIPTLAEVLDLVGSAAHVDIEVKAKEAAAAVIREAEDRRDLRWAMSSFDHDVLRFARSQSTSIELWPLVVTVTADALATAIDLRSPVIAIHDRSVIAEVVDKLATRSIGIWVWTVNDPERARMLARWSIAGICTDDPQAILDAVGSQERIFRRDAG